MRILISYDVIDSARHSDWIGFDLKDMCDECAWVVPAAANGENNLWPKLEHGLR